MQTKWVPIVVAVSLATGFLTGRGAEKKSVAPEKPMTGDITVLRMNKAGETGVPYKLHPYTYRTGGTTVKLAEPPENEGDIWIVTLDDERVFISATPK